MNFLNKKVIVSSKNNHHAIGKAINKYVKNKRVRYDVLMEKGSTVVGIPVDHKEYGTYINSSLSKQYFKNYENEEE